MQSIPPTCSVSAQDPRPAACLLPLKERMYSADFGGKIGRQHRLVRDAVRDRDCHRLDRRVAATTRQDVPSLRQASSRIRRAIQDTGTHRQQHAGRDGAQNVLQDVKANGPAAPSRRRLRCRASFRWADQKPSLGFPTAPSTRRSWVSDLESGDKPRSRSRTAASREWMWWGTIGKWRLSHKGCGLLGPTGPRSDLARVIGTQKAVI